LRMAPVFQDAKATSDGGDHVGLVRHSMGTQFLSQHDLDDLPRESNIVKRIWEQSYSSMSTAASTVKGNRIKKQSDKLIDNIDTKVKQSTNFRSIEDEKNFLFLKDWCMEFEKAGAVTQEAKTSKDGTHSGAHLPQTHAMRASREVTTIMVKNLPNRVHVEDLVEKLEGLGFAGRCDYVYMPMDWQTHANKGFAFANFKTAEDALDLATMIEGTSLFGNCSSSGKRMTSCPATRQGIVENLRSVSYTCRKDKLNFPWVLIGDAPALVGMRPPEALERLKQLRECGGSART